MMEAGGVVGPIDGAKPREILMSRMRVDEMFATMRNSLSQQAFDDEEEELEEFFEEETPAGEPASTDGAHTADATAADGRETAPTAHRGGAAGWGIEDEEAAG